MRIDGTWYRSLWLAEDGETVEILDQTRLPFAVRVARLTNLEEAARAIETMQVRGAPLIGATAAYGVALGLREDASDEALHRALERLGRTRPTAVNLRWALERLEASLAQKPAHARAAAAYAEAAEVAEEDVRTNRRIGEHGLALLRDVAAARGGAPVRVLTHCNAGWLATVDWGTATAPLYRAHDDGVPLHVYVDETRPRNQGALTAWELGQHGVPHTYVVDNAGGHLLQRGLVDLCLVGTDRTTLRGDVANKIGTYLKALAARDNDVPFYVALPTSTIDRRLEEGLAVPIETRDDREVSHVRGALEDGQEAEVRLVPPGTRVANPAFDVTPARLVTALLTEHGLVEPTARAIGDLLALGAAT